jgi:hypothetical protein
MKKAVIKLLIAVLLITCMVMLLNIEVTYRQGINFEVSTVRIPLYLKVLDFFDRHYNYKNLVSKIIKSSDSPEERVIKIFNWTYDNIKRAPDGYPIVDDHVWHIIIRGYGTLDQSNDVFTTLCNYAGVDAFFDFIYSRDKSNMTALSFIKLNHSWRIFDSYNGVYFRNNKGEIASLEDIMRGDWFVFNTTGMIKQNSDYAKYLENLSPIGDIGLKRANIQSPLRRLIFQFKKLVGVLR